MAKNIRNLPGNNVQDPSVIDNLIYNEAAGSRKSTQVGGHLLPVPYVSGANIAYTTDLSTIRNVGPGACLAIFNTDTTLHAVTLGEANSQTALAAGITDSTGHVGIPCPPGQWTYVACATQNWVITDSATLKVFIIDDYTYMRTEQK